MAAQDTRDSRWITIRTPFDYIWPSRASTRYSDPGEFQVKNEVADFAVGKGYAEEGKLDGTAKSRKGGKKRTRTRKKKDPATATTANAGSGASVGDADATGAGGAAGGASVADNAG